MDTYLHLEPLSSSVAPGSTVVFYGWLYDDDGFFLEGATIYVKDDVGLGSDETIAILTTDIDGEFYAEWTAERRPSGGSWDFYAVFEGEPGLDRSRSETYRMDVAGGAARGTHLDLDPLPVAASVGDAVRFSGWLYDDTGSPVRGATIYVKDDVGLGSDETIAILTTDADGTFSTAWTAERRPSGGSWDFYAVFEGEPGLRKSRSDTYAVEVAGIASVPQPDQPPAPPSEDDSGCLIATAAHGTELAPQVQALREYRDGTLMSTGHGRAIVPAFSAAYYAFSPHVADLEREHPAVRQAAAALIAPLLYALQAAALADHGSDASVLAHGAAAALLAAGLYAGIPAAALAAAGAAGAAMAARRRRRSGGTFWPLGDARRRWALRRNAASGGTAAAAVASCRMRAAARRFRS